MEGGKHSQHFLKPKSALIFILLSAVFTLFFQFLQFSIRKKNVFFNYGQGGSGPRLLLAKINQFHTLNQYFIEFSLGPEPPWPQIKKTFFFLMLNCKNWKKSVKTAKSRTKIKALLGFKKCWEWFPPSKILPNF